MKKDSSRRRNKSKKCSPAKLQSVLMEPGWKEIVVYYEHINNLLQLLGQQISIKLPKNSAKEFVKDLRMYLSSSDGLLTEQQISMINLLNQKDLIVINAAKVIKKMLILLIQFCLSTENLSMSSLRQVVFKVVPLLPKELKILCQKEILSESIKQLQMDNTLKDINPGSSVNYLFAMMVVDDYIEADEVILVALEQIQYKNTHIAKAMLEVLCIEYPQELRQKCNKPLNLKHLLDRLKEKGQPIENYSLNVFDEFNQKTLQTKQTFQLANVIQNFRPLDEQKLCLAVHHFQSLQDGGYKLNKVVSLKFQEIQNEVNDPECLRQFLTGISMKKFHIDTKTQKAVLEQITKNISKFNAEQCQSILHKLVLQNIRDHNFAYLIVKQLCEKIEQVDTEALGKSIWSIGAIGTFIDINQKQCLEKKMYDLLDEFDERTITLIFFGLAGTFWQDYRLLKRLCLQINKLLKNNYIQIPSLKLAVGVLGNLIKFNFYNEGLYNIFCDIIQKNIKDLHILDLVYLISAFGFVENSMLLENQQLQSIFQNIVDQIEIYFRKLNQLELIKVFQSIAHTKLKFNIDQKLLKQMLQKLKKTNFFSGFQAADLICCVAKVHEKNLLTENQHQLISFFIEFITTSKKKISKQKEQEVSWALKILGVNQQEEL